MDDLTLAEVVLLAALSDRARYGYELVERVEELTDGKITMRPGNLYRVLHRLADSGLVTELAGPAGTDERRRYFRATPLGRRTAARQLAMYVGVLQRVPALRDAIANG